MSEEAEVQKPKANSKVKTLQVEYAVYDATGEGKWYRSGDTVETVDAYLQGLLDTGFAKLV